MSSRLHSGLSAAARRAANRVIDVGEGATEGLLAFADELEREVKAEAETDAPGVRRGMDHGLYVIHWCLGGQSIAAVGYDAEGRNWFAPTNWISCPSFDWTHVASVQPILLERDWRSLKERL